MKKLQRSFQSGRFPMLPAVALMLATACGTASEPEAAPSLLPESPVSTGCIAEGHVKTALYGAIEGQIDWQGDALHCEGMPRPDAEGARLRFSGPAPDGDKILVLIASVPGITRDETGTELSTRLTIIEEGDARFFAAPDFDICWTDVTAVESIDENRQRLEGRIYCITPLNQVNGNASLNAPEIEFSGFIDWNAS